MLCNVCHDSKLSDYMKYTGLEFFVQSVFKNVSHIVYLQEITYGNFNPLVTGPLYLAYSYGKIFDFNKEGIIEKNS